VKGSHATEVAVEDDVAAEAAGDDDDVAEAFHIRHYIICYYYIIILYSHLKFPVDEECNEFPHVFFG
jgi:hypothetical protein